MCFFAEPLAWVKIYVCTCFWLIFGNVWDRTSDLRHSQYWPVYFRVPCALDVYALAKASYMTPWDENGLTILIHYS